MTTDTEKFMPDVHRELHRVNALGDVVAIEVSIQLGILPGLHLRSRGVRTRA